MHFKTYDTSFHHIFLLHLFSSCLHHPIVVEAKYVSGHLVTHENWAFLERFCFLSIDGSFEYRIEFEYDPERMGNISLLMYPDSVWGRAYKNKASPKCEQKRAVLKEEFNQIVPLKPGLFFSSTIGAGCEIVTRKRHRSPSLKLNTTTNSTNSSEVVVPHSSTVLCKDKRKFKSARERWWFICIASCDSMKGLDIKYSFIMKNGNFGDYWYEHFSADEFYILPILTSFCFIYLFLLFCALIFAVELKCRQLLHTTYKLFLVSLILQTVGIMHLCIAYGNYASNGIGLPSIKLLGRLLEGGSEFVFLLLLLLLAKGFTVTRGRLRPASAVKLTVFNCSYILLYGLLFVFEQYTFDPGLVLYIYESEAGYGILVLRMVGYLMFAYGVFFTLKHYSEKASFYIPFFGVFSLWFISGPIVILITNHVIDKWVREKVAMSIQHVISFVGHVVFLGLTRPSAANKSFPYHVGMVDDKTDSRFGEDSFHSHLYAPSAPAAYDVFTVSGSLDRTNGQPNFDMFSATGGLGLAHDNNNTILTTPNLPAVFPVASEPKYKDAFPHEKPGQIEELLREGDLTDDEESSDRGIGSEGSCSSASYRPNSGNNNAEGEGISNSSRERKYVCRDVALN